MPEKAGVDIPEFSILEKLPLGAIVIDENFVIRHWNRRLADWSKTPASDMVGTKLTDKYPHLKETKYASRIVSVFSGAPASIFSALLHKYIIPIPYEKNEFRVQETTVTSMKGKNGEKLALFIIEDVTDITSRLKEYRALRDKALQEIEFRKEIEHELREAKLEAEEMARVKDKFISLVSHDLTSPLSTMLGYLEIVHDDMPENEPMKRMISVAIESGENMGRLIKELLSVGRLKAGKMHPDFAFFGAYLHVNGVISRLAPFAKAKEVEIVNEISERIRLYADPVLFGEVIQNLISNSIKFCRKGGRINIFLPEGKPSTVAVSDTGIGISPGKLPLIFNYDEKTSTSGTAGEKGTGLGLPLCRDIIEAHGGVISAESELGKGSLFKAYFPYRKPRVLIVDDEINEQKIIGYHLEKIGCDIFGAGNGREAMELLSASQIDIVVSDIMMPEMDGFELISKIKNSEKLKSIPVIMVTSDVGMETREKAIALGAADFTNKPIEFNNLIPRVRRIIG